jgi:fimbrial chaperone protein
VVRLILRLPRGGREATYRILVDLIPPPAEQGVVHVVLRLSIPIFAQPTTPAVPHIQFHLEQQGGQLVLVGVNHGLRHEALRNIALRTSDGRELKEEPGASPYILAIAATATTTAASTATTTEERFRCLIFLGFSGPLIRRTRL